MAVVAERSDERLTRVRSVLRLHRVATVEFQDARRAGGYLAARQTPLLIVVPGSPSWAVAAVAALRSSSKAPIVVSGLTPSSDELAELLEVGATIVIDYGAREREISARIKALYEIVRSEPRASSRWLESGDLRVDLFSKTCAVGGEDINLSRNEYRLLVYLMSRAQQTINATDIVNHVWQWNYGDGLNTLRIHVARLRRKLRDDSRNSKYIVSIRGAGYRFKDPVVELGDDGGTGDSDIAALSARLDGIYALLDTVRSLDSVSDLAAVATTAPVASSHCDAASIFRCEPERSRSTLIAADGMSNEWTRKMRRGHNLSSDFVGGQAIAEGNAVQVADLRRSAKRFPVSAALMNEEHFRSCLVVPLRVNGAIWGDIGFVKRQPRAFSPNEATFLHSIAGVLELKLSTLAD
ncbi:MAG: winged helix-turn-helix domain-containing protein [Actinobacteria bacterium]|nr:winged helix-turn-helix domain-containing protein [Actinomycetota bacterium]